jgi:tetratricopeptide (TPR) repeat protein
LHVGELETARGALENGLRIGRDAGIYWNQSSFTRASSEIHFNSGDLDKAYALAEEALKIAEDQHDEADKALAGVWLGRVLVRRDSPQSGRAEKLVLEGIGTLENLKLKPYSAVGYFRLGELHADRDERQEALRNLTKAEGMFREMGMEHWLSRTQEAIGRLGH